MNSMLKLILNLQIRRVFIFGYMIDYVENIDQLQK